MARKQLFDITTADVGRQAYEPPPRQADPEPTNRTGEGPSPPRQQAYRQGKRAVMFFLPEEAFSQMHVILARQGRKKVQLLMEELVDDWFRREGAPRLLK
jgi:hypothetical protein